MTVKTGGCQCGRVRYSVETESIARRCKAAGREVPE